MRKRYIVSWMCFLGLCGCDLVYDYDPSQMYTVRKEACEMSVERATAAINVGVPGDRKVRYNGYFEYKLGRCSCRNELCQLGEVCNDYVTKDAASCVDYVCSDGVVVCSSTETGEGYLYRCENNNWVQPVRCLIGCAEDGKSCIDHQVVECDDGDRYCSEMNGQKAFWTCEDGGYIYETCHHGCDQANGCLHKNECTDGEQACVGELIKECVQGGWLAAHSCGEGRKCTENTCLSEGENVCDEEKYRCSHKEHKLELCQNNTWVAQDLDKCVVCKTGNSTNAKRFVLGESKEAVCEIFEEKVVCDGKNLMSCMKGKWEGPAICPNGCTEGKCIQCIEDECVDGNLRSCIEGKWTEVETCEHGCSNGKCNECKDGTFKCDSQKKLWKCENGTWGKNFDDIEKHCKCPSENSGNANVVYESIYNICNNICVNNGNNIGKLYNKYYPNGNECVSSKNKSEVLSCNQTLDGCGECKNGLFKCESSDGGRITLWTCKDGKPEEEKNEICEMCSSHNSWGSKDKVCGELVSDCKKGASKCFDKVQIDECENNEWLRRACIGGCENQTAASNNEVIEGICLGEEHYTCGIRKAINKYLIFVNVMNPSSTSITSIDKLNEELRLQQAKQGRCLICGRDKSKKVDNVVSGIKEGETICIDNKNYKCMKGNDTYELKKTGNCQHADR